MRPSVAFHPPSGYLGRSPGAGLSPEERNDHVVMMQLCQGARRVEETEPGEIDDALRGQAPVGQAKHPLDGWQATLGLAAQPSLVERDGSAAFEDRVRVRHQR